MEFSTLTLYLTERCNFRCSYCYQSPGRRTLAVADLDRALDFFRPHLAASSEVHFYGGEPLLAFGLISRAVESLEKKRGAGRKIRFGLTTNGSLINEDVIAFFRDHHFRLMISFDGLAQDQGRRKGSGPALARLLERLLQFPAIQVETNSVFTPKTVRLLAASLKLIHQMGVGDIRLAFSNLEPWPVTALTTIETELADYGRFARSRRRKTDRIPLDIFRPSRRRGIFGCGGGANRIAVAPDGTVWGCYLFVDRCRGRGRSTESRRFGFGRLDRFIRDYPELYPRIVPRYTGLRMSGFETPEGECRACPEVEDCAICPLDAAAPGDEIGRIPIWTCRIAKILRRARDRFLGR